MIMPFRVRNRLVSITAKAFPAGGMAALHSALASCAPGVVVVNIDNGFGAACAALKMLRVFAPKPE